MSNSENKLEGEDYAFNMWVDEDYDRIIQKYCSYRQELLAQAKLKEIDNYEPNFDVPPHIRNWFENPIYQTLVKPSKSQIVKLFYISEWLTIITFVIGVILLGGGLWLIFQSPAADSIAVVSLILSGTAGILASLFRSAAAIKDTAIQHEKLYISISAGMVSLDAMQRIVGHQEKLTPEELETIQEITKALAPLIKAFENAPEQK